MKNNERDAGVLREPATERAEARMARHGAAIYVRVSSLGQLDRAGDEDGYSIPAQVKACEREAADRGAVVTKVYIERAESARSDNRPVLQQMMAELPTLGADMLIVHKVDRLARNRLDDATLYERLVGMGIKLVSATENIDETPAGQLMHGMLATFAEYYSNNLANEVKKGMRQKHAAGGTPFKPPLGYLPHREISGNRDIRTVILDEKRAPLIRTMFELYADGDCSLIKLAARMEMLGLTSRATAKRPEHPLGISAVHKILTNEYYAGTVTYAGAKAQGSHEPLISRELFARVQVLLETRRHGERASKHEHYLRGTIFCEACGGRLLFGRHKGRSESYDYYSCRNRATRGHSPIKCDVGYFPVADVERAVEEEFAKLRLSPEQRVAIQNAVDSYAEEQRSVASVAMGRHRKRIAELEEKERSLIELYYEKLISKAAFANQQAELAVQREAISMLQAKASEIASEVDGVLDHMLTLMSNPQDVYLRATDAERRVLNRLLWKRVLVRADDDELVVSEPAPLVSALRAVAVHGGAPVLTAAEAPASLEGEIRSGSTAGHHTKHHRRPSRGGGSRCGGSSRASGA